MSEAATEDRPQSLVGFASPPRIFSDRGHVRDCQPRGRFQVCSPTPIRGGISARANLAFDQRVRRWSNGFYGPAFVEEGLRAWEVAPDWENILARYRVNAALLPVDSALASVLRERRDWKPVYLDRVAVLFEKCEDVR